MVGEGRSGVGQVVWTGGYSVFHLAAKVTYPSIFPNSGPLVYDIYSPVNVC